MKIFSIIVSLATSIVLTGCSTSSDSSAASPKAIVATQKMKGSERLNGETVMDCVGRIGVAEGKLKIIKGGFESKTERAVEPFIKRCK